MRFAVIVVLLGACVEADDATTKLPVSADLATADEGMTEDAICAAAAALPASDMCSLVCDPEAFRARLVDDGMKGGACYQIRCNLAPEMSVTVGVCLP